MDSKDPEPGIEADIASAYSGAFEDALPPVAQSDLAAEGPVPDILARANRDLGLRDAVGLGFSRLLHVLLALFASAHKSTLHSRQAPALRQPSES